MWHVKQQARGIATTPTDWAWRFNSEDAGSKREREMEEEERVLRRDEGKEHGSRPRQAMEWPFRTTMVSTEFEPSVQARRGTLVRNEEQSELEADGQKSRGLRPTIERAK